MFAYARLRSISSALALPDSRGRHGKLADNGSDESDVMSMQDSDALTSKLGDNFIHESDVTSL